MKNVINYLICFKNILINNLKIITRTDNKNKMVWEKFIYNPNKSDQANAGFSENHEVCESINKVKIKLEKTLFEYVPKNSNILDCGCGPGIYMSLLAHNYRTFGIDISQEMLNIAHRKLPESKFYHGSFLQTKFDESYNAIYSISVLQYIPVSQINVFFKKCSSLLEKEGILIIQYPHALKYIDLYYPDINYICYSPVVLENEAIKYFKIIEHRHSFDNRSICKYDKNPYPTSSKTFKNGYILIARKR